MKIFSTTALLILIVGHLAGCGSSGNSGQPSVTTSSVAASSSQAATSTSSVSHSSATSSSASSPETCLSEGTGTVPDELPGFSVNAGHLYDGRGNRFIMRGVNYPYAWFQHRDTEQDLEAIASTCANSVRIVLSNGERSGWNRVAGSTVSDLIRWSRENNLVAILEVHDATGWSENTQAATPQTTVDYWLSEDIRIAIEGTENHVIINIANEPLGNFANANEDRERWLDFHTQAIADLRDAGISHTLIVDAPNWGQDWTNSMRDGDAAQQVFDADAQSNTVFSVHMYDVYGTYPANKQGRVEAYLAAFADKQLPLIIGEFAADHGPGDVNKVDVDAIFTQSAAYDMGYLGWSWSGNASPLESLDIVQHFDINQLSDWGHRLINGTNGLRHSSQVCSCFQTDPEDTH